MIGKSKIKNQKSKILGFTLIELLVVISIIGILAGLSIFGLQGARESARDGRRRSDLEQIRSGLELYKSDCGDYPATASLVAGSPLMGGGPPPTTCLATNTYISNVPDDPSPGRDYRYARLTSTTYEICASLERGTGSVTCGGLSTCGTGTCNYKATNP